MEEQIEVRRVGLTLDIEDFCHDAVKDARVDGEVVSLLVPRVVEALKKHGLAAALVGAEPQTTVLCAACEAHPATVALCEECHMEASRAWVSAHLDSVPPDPKG